MLISVDEIECYLEEAGIDICAPNIEALRGMVGLDYKSPSECVEDLKAYIELGVTWI